MKLNVGCGGIFFFFCLNVSVFKSFGNLEPDRKVKSVKSKSV